MTTFPCFITPRHLRTTGITDVNTILSDLDTELEAAGWTDETGGVYKCAVSSSGRFCKVTLTRIDADTVELVVKDQNGFTVCTRRADIDAAGTAVQYYVGAHYFAVDIERATREQLQAGILDLSPVPDNGHSVYTYGTAHRTSGGTAGSNTAGNLFMLDNGVSASENRVITEGACNDAGTTGVLTPMIHGSGAYRFAQAVVAAQIGGANRRYAGRIFNSMRCDPSHAFDTEFTCVIGDAGETGVFRVIGLSTLTVGVAQFRRMYRKS